MAEILVMARDNVSTDPEADAMLYKTGDVVCVRPDGWPWSVSELDPATFQLVKIPGEDVVELEAELTRPGTNGSQRRRRQVRLDLPPQAMIHIVNRQQLNVLLKARG